MTHSVYPMPMQTHIADGVHPKLRWLMLARLSFTAFLLASTLFLQYRHQDPALTPFLTHLYLIIITIFFLSLLYALVYRRIKPHKLFAYIQIGLDSFIVSLIVLITGGYFSLFSFLYLVVIIYASMILFFKGGLFIALLSSLQYAALILAQSVFFSPPQGVVLQGQWAFNPSGQEIVYKILITAAACFAVAVLSGLLTEQNRKSQRQLSAMTERVKRVEKMAYMGEMSAGLAHEIKNPLASLVGSIQLLKEELNYDPDHRRLMEIVLRETDRLSTLANDFLLFARPPAGKPDVLPLKEAIEDIVGLFERDVNHAKRFSMKRTLAPDIYVLMDSIHLRQVLWNLLLNSAQAVSDGGLVEIHTVPIRNHEVSVYVQDNGCGIAPEAMASIFDPFFTTKSEGTGLGLSIVHRILEAYDSHLEVQSEVERGTTFSFVLNRAKRAVSSAASSNRQ